MSLKQKRNNFMFAYKNIIDISLPLDEKTIVYPGDPSLSMEKIKKTSGSQLTKISLGTHFGSHVDAPSHVFDSGKNINEIPLENFVGHCRVLDVRECQESITKEIGRASCRERVYVLV